MVNGNRFSVRSFPSFLPFLPYPFPSLVISLGVPCEKYLVRSTSWQFLALLSWSQIAGIDDLVKSFFQKVFPLGIAGMSYGCKAFVHGKQKMRIYF